MEESLANVMEKFSLSKHASGPTYGGTNVQVSLIVLRICDYIVCLVATLKDFSEKYTCHLPLISIVIVQFSI